MTLHEDETDDVISQLQNHAERMKCERFFFNKFYLRKGGELFFFLTQINPQNHANVIFRLTKGHN
jgi:hypothetical protein